MGQPNLQWVGRVSRQRKTVQKRIKIQQLINSIRKKQSASRVMKEMVLNFITNKSKALYSYFVDFLDTLVPHFSFFLFWEEKFLYCDEPSSCKNREKEFITTTKLQTSNNNCFFQFVNNILIIIYRQTSLFSTLFLDIYPPNHHAKPFLTQFQSPLFDSFAQSF